MALLASEVMQLSGALLNDPSNITYSYAILLPHLKVALDQLQSKMLENGISALDTKTAVLALTAVTSVSITSATTPVLPADLIVPIGLEERPTGSGALFSPMHEREELPSRDQGNSLIDWTWEEEGIKLVGALVNTDVKITYQKSVGAVAASGDSIYILGSRLFLAARTGSLAATIIGRNPERASFLGELAERELQSFIRIRVKEAQDISVRRLPYGFLRRQLRRVSLRSGR